MLNASYNPNGNAGRAWFQWGTTTNYGAETGFVGGSGTNDSNIGATVVNLQPLTTYQFRVVASNSSGVVYGSNLNFATLAGVNPIGPNVGLDSEPNNSADTATPLQATNVHIISHIFPAGDVDYYSFSAQAGDRVYAAAITAFSPNSMDSRLSVIGTNGSTVIESDDNDGNFGGNSSSIAGTTIPATGTYYLLVQEPNGNNVITPYDLWFRLVRGSPSTEIEPNDTGVALPASGWVSGNLSSATDLDTYTIVLNAGDSIFASLDLDPERDGVEWDGQLAFGPFSGQMLTVNDTGGTGPDSEAFVCTVKNPGTYSLRVSAASTTFGPYHLSVAVLPKPAGFSTTYFSTDTPLNLTDAGNVTSTIIVPDNKRVGHVQVYLNLSHANLPDVDISLTAPNGNTVTLFSDLAQFAAAGQPVVDVGLDDDAALPISLFTIHSGMISRPEPNSHLGWFKGQQAQGTWTLKIYDDTAANTGVLNDWQLVILDELPPLGPTATIYSSDFEADGGGFTHSGLQDEWERGTPTFAPITNCNSGVNCWKTDLDASYNAFATNDLFSPTISLAGVLAPTRIVLNWAMKYQFENARFDHASVNVEEVGGSGRIRTVWSWRDGTMSETVGAPIVTNLESAGWAIHRALLNDFAGKTIRLRFHFESDISVQLAGWAIDDVSVVAYPAITKIGNEYRMNLLAPPDQRTRVQYSTNLSLSSAWTELAPPIILTAPASGVFGFTDTNPPNAQRFYRAIPDR